MTKSIDKPNGVNVIGTFRSEDAAHGRTSVSCGPSQSIIQGVHHVESDSVNFQVYSLIVGIPRGRLREIVDMLERRSANI